MIQKMSEFCVGILTWISCSCNFGRWLNKGFYFQCVFKIFGTVFLAFVLQQEKVLLYVWVF